MTLRYLDTGVVLALAQGDDRWFRAAQTLIEGPETRVVTSDMVWLEVWPSTHVPRGTVLRRVYEALFARAEQTVAVNALVVGKAREMAARAPIKGADAIHAAAAVLGGAVEFVTTEKPTKPLHAVLPAYGVQVRQLGDGR